MTYRTYRQRRQRRNAIITLATPFAIAAVVTGITVPSVAAVENAHRAVSLQPVSEQMGPKILTDIETNFNSLNQYTFSPLQSYNPRTLTGTFTIFSNTGNNAQYQVTGQCTHLPPSQRGIGATAGAVGCSVIRLKQIGP